MAVRGILIVFFFNLVSFVCGCGASMIGNPGDESDQIKEQTPERKVDFDEQMRLIASFYSRVLDNIEQTKLQSPTVQVSKGINESVDNLQNKIDRALKALCDPKLPDLSEFNVTASQLFASSEEEFLQFIEDFRAEVKAKEKTYLVCIEENQ